MKHLFFVAVLCITSVLMYAQKPAIPGNSGNVGIKWGVSGNSISPGNFLGTTNVEDLVFKTSDTQRMILTKDGNLGLGIANPAARLDVLGNVNIHGNMYISGSIVSGYEFQGTKMGADSMVAKEVRANLIELQQSLVIDGDNSTIKSELGFIHFDGTSLLEVGTLHAQGINSPSLNISSNAYIENLSVANSLNVPNLSASNISFSNLPYLSGTAKNLVLDANGQVRQTELLEYWKKEGSFIYSDAPRVGIGTDDPTSILDIATTGSPTLNIRTTQEGSPQTASINLKGSQNGGVIGAINFSNIASPNDVDAYIKAYNYIAPDVARIIIGTSYFGEPQTGFALSGNGNVGIGTETPAAKLDVQGNVKIATINEANEATEVLVNNGGFIGRKSISSFSPWTAAENSITYNGHKVGIGTNNPVKNLHIVGLTQLQSDPGNGNVSGEEIYASRSAVLRLEDIVCADINNPIETTTHDVFWDFTVSGNNHKLYFETDGGDQTKETVMTMTEGGNVGIGTEFPSANLQVAGSVKFDGLQPMQSGSFLVKDGDGNLGFKELQSGDWQMDADGNLYYNDGDVKINNYLKLTNKAQIEFFSEFTASRIWGMGCTGAANSDDFIIYNHNKLNPTDANEIGTKFAIDAETGSVAIGGGHFSGNSALTVNGKIYAEEIEVVQNVESIPDYVFDENYNLKSLREVEEFIRTNKHLPEIPSAMEIGADGMNLGEMNVLLLKKIEELTLYSIEQNKRIEKLEEELKKNNQ